MSRSVQRLGNGLAGTGFEFLSEELLSSSDTSRPTLGLAHTYSLTVIRVRFVGGRPRLDFEHLHRSCTETGTEWSCSTSHTPHNDVSVNDGPHIRRWSHKIIILYYNTIVLQLPAVFSTVTFCTGL